MTRAVQDTGRDLADRHALGPGQRRHVLPGRLVEVDDAGRIAGPDGDLLHIHVWRIQQSAALGHGEHADRIGLVLGAQCRALQRIDCDIDLGAIAGADFLADVEHRRLVALALADDDAAFDVHIAHLAAHRLDGGGVGCLLVAFAAPAGRGNRRRLGNAHQLQREGTIDRRLPVGIGLAELHKHSLPRRRGAKGILCGRVPNRESPRGTLLKLLDPDHLRIADDEAVTLDRLQGVADGLLHGGVREQHHRTGVGSRHTRLANPQVRTLDDAFERDAGATHAGSNSGKRARHIPDI